MREFDDSKMKMPFSLGDIIHEMYRQTWFDSRPVRYVYKDVEIVMRKNVSNPPIRRQEK